MRRIKIPGWRLLLLILATGAGLALPSGPAAAANTPWIYQTIHTYGDTGQYTSLISEPTGAMGITYYSATWQALRTAWANPGQGNCDGSSNWNCFGIDTASSNVGKYSSQAYNATGDYEGVAYQDAGAHALKFASNQCVPACNYQAWTIDNTPGVLTAQGTSLKFDSTGRPQIAYYQAFPAALKYAQYVGGGAGNCPNTDWQCDTIESGTALGQYPSLDLNAIGQPRIAYYDGGTGQLKYAYRVVSGGTGCSGGNVSSTWTCEVVDASGGAVGSFAVLHQSKCMVSPCTDATQIAYYDEANHALKYAHTDGNGQCSAGAAFGWQCDTIETVGQWTSPALYVSMVVDSNNSPLIAYYDHDDGANGRLKLASPVATGNCGPNGGLFYSWQCDTIDYGNSLGGSHDVGLYPSMIVSNAGLVSVAYHDATAKDLLWATQLSQQTIIFGALPSKNASDPPFSISATASSGLAVTFKASGKCSLSGNSVTLSGLAGSCTIMASQAGDSTYSAAPDVSRSFAINNPAKQNQTITFATLPNKTLGDPSFQLSAIASSGLTVGFSGGTPAICTVSGTTVALLSPGTCTVVAAQDGDGSFNAAADVTQSFLIVSNAPPVSNTNVYLSIIVR